MRFLVERPIPISCVVALVCLSISVPGCKPPPPGEVVGSVTINGEPLNGAIVTFEDVSQGVGQSAPISAGEFRMPAPIAVGDYTVVIQPPPPPAPTAKAAPGPKVSIPEKYTKPGTSGLTATVESGKNDFDFKLTK